MTDTRPPIVDPEWLVPGAAVALVSTHRGLAPRARLTTVTRLTKTQVVLDDNTRVSRRYLTRSLGTWDGSETLVSADHPRVNAARVAQAQVKAWNRMYTIWEDMRRSRPDRVADRMLSARALLEATQSYITTLEES